MKNGQAMVSGRMPKDDFASNKKPSGLGRAFYVVSRLKS
jgi:hypothetical protein